MVALGALGPGRGKYGLEGMATRSETRRWSIDLLFANVLDPDDGFGIRNVGFDCGDRSRKMVEVDAGWCFGPRVHRLCSSLLRLVKGLARFRTRVGLAPQFENLGVSG